MSTQEQNVVNVSFWIKFRRRLTRLLWSRGSCSGSCNDCVTCPWIDKDKYSFEIKKRDFVEETKKK